MYVIIYGVNKYSVRVAAQWQLAWNIYVPTYHKIKLRFYIVTVIWLIPPSPEAALKWLEAANENAGRDIWRGLLALGDGAPLRALELFKNDFQFKNMEFEEKFKLISENKLDPLAVADEWVKGGVELPLTWLTTRLRLAIRRRMAPKASNRVTDIEPDELHNAWQNLTAKELFEKLEASESLLNQLGRGTNVELTLRALLLAFHPHRERS